MKILLLAITFITLMILGCTSPMDNRQLFVISVGEKDGCIDSMGNIVLEPKYQRLNENSIGEGLIGFQENDKWGYINYFGKVVIEPQYKFCLNFNDGLAPVVDYNNKWGAINKKGEWIIDPIYDYVSPFQNGLATVEIKFVENSNQPFYSITDKLTGVLNLKGEIVIPIEFVTLSHTPGFTDDLIVLNTQEMGSSVFSKEGKLLFTKPYYILSYSNGLALCYDPFKKQNFFIDKLGDVKFEISENYQLIDVLSEGMALIVSNNKYGFLDTTGKIIIEPKFEQAWKFNCGLAKIKIGEKYGFINKQGKVIIQATYDEVDDFYCGMSKVKLGNKKGYINTKGKWIWSNNS